MKSEVDMLIEVLQNANIDDLYDRMAESLIEPIIFENIIQWKLGLRDHPFTIEEEKK